MELTRTIIDLDSECSRVVYDARKEASSLLFQAERKAEKVLTDAQVRSSIKREESFLKLEETLKSFRKRREMELKAKEDLLFSSLSKEEFAKELAQSLLKGLASDLRKG